MPDTMLPVEQLPSAMPAEITKAIVAVMAGVGKLAKAEKNNHDHYDFVSIDGFLSAVNPLCAQNGLVILQDEESVEFIERQGRNGTSTWLRVTYSFTVAHVSGAVMQRQPRRTVMTIANGAQAFGAAQSYSLKQFMRSLFQISTGDKDDPDFHQTQDIPAQACQKPPQRVEQPRRAETPPKPKTAIQDSPTEPEEPVHMPMTMGPDGPFVGRWTRAALETLDGKSEAWRRGWLEMHQQELDDVRVVRPDYADKVVSACISPDLPEAAE